MYEAKILGIRTVNFKDDNGNVVSGFNIWTSHSPAEGHGWEENVEILKHWISSSSPAASAVPSLVIGAEVVLSFNRYGKISEIDV